MNVEIKPDRHGSLFSIEGNLGLFAFQLLHAVGRYVLHAQIKQGGNTFLPMTQPVVVTISDEYPPKCYVDGNELLVNNTVTKAGLIITRTG